MPNSQIFPASTYPLVGDVKSTPGSPLVQVTGIQSTPVDPATPQPQQLLVMGSDGQWHPEDPQVSGTDAVGTTPTKPPVQTGGIDDGNLVRELRTDTYGSIQLSMIDRQLLIDILNTNKAILRAIVNLDNTNQDQDYVADQFDNVDPMQ
jgi:hypothetical protein